MPTVNFLNSQLQTFATLNLFNCQLFKQQLLNLQLSTFRLPASSTLEFVNYYFSNFLRSTKSPIIFKLSSSHFLNRLLTELQLLNQPRTVNFLTFNFVAAYNSFNFHLSAFSIFTPKFCSTIYFLDVQHFLFSLSTWSQEPIWKLGFDNWSDIKIPWRNKFYL